MKVHVKIVYQHVQSPYLLCHCIRHLKDITILKDNQKIIHILLLILFFLLFFLKDVILEVVAYKAW